jgi:peptidoglycan/LPS O-acetylase OafA/YrhL
MNSKPREKLLYLEGLRGIAAYGVFLVHFLDGYWEEGLEWIKFWQDFNVFVALFFMLSGRILTASALRSRKIHSIAIAICKRPWRLGLPLIAVTIINALVMNLRFGTVYSFMQTVFHPIYYMVYNGDVLSPIPGVAWTMPHEFLGSMVVYSTTLVLLYFDSKKSNFIILSILIGFTVFTHTWVSHFLIGLTFAVFKSELGFLTAKRGSREWINSILFKILTCLIVFLLCFDSPIGIGRNFSNFVKSHQVIIKLFTY